MKTYFPVINLFRGIAALMVCMYHFIHYSDFRGNLFSSDSFISELGALGVNGVFVFFVISGFVIPLSLYNDNFKLRQTPLFLLRRLIRIEIPYFASILLILFVGFLFSQKEGTGFYVDAKQFMYHIIYFIPFSSYSWYNVIYWTLAIEFQFYLIIGVLYLFLSSENKNIVLLSVMLFGLSNYLVTDDRFIFHYAIIFSQGILLFLFKLNKIDPKTGLIAFAILIISTGYLHSVAVSVFTAMTVAGIQFLDINKGISNRFGEISYSLYLTHGIIGGNFLYFTARYCNDFSLKILLVAGAVGLSLLFAYLFWKLIENPSRKLSRKIRIQ